MNSLNGLSCSQNAWWRRCWIIVDRDRLIERFNSCCGKVAKLEEIRVFSRVNSPMDQWLNQLTLIYNKSGVREVNLEPSPSRLVLSISINSLSDLYIDNIISCQPPHVNRISRRYACLMSSVQHPRLRRSFILRIGILQPSSFSRIGRWSR